MSGCCSAKQAIAACRGLELQTTAAPLSAILTSVTITASAHTTQASFLFAGKITPMHDIFTYERPLNDRTCLRLSCLVGNDFWYMGQRCDLRMTRARLVGACVAILLVIVTVICVLAFVAVRRYKAILIQAKVDQTRSRYAPLDKYKKTQEKLKHTVHFGNIHFKTITIICNIQW